MLKKHKPLAILTVTITSAILCVLGFWLYSSYEDHQELTFAKADQALLSTLNDYYIKHEINTGNSRSSYQKNLVNDIASAYPNVSADSVYGWMEKNATRRQDSIRKKFQDSHRQAARERNGRRRPREINHWMLQGRDVNLSDSAIDALLAEYIDELGLHGIHLANATLNVQKIDRKAHSVRHKARYGATLTTRPILINAENDIYLYAELTQTWRHILSNMAGQVIFSILLLLSLVGTFFILFKTISKQHKLAVLQRSFVTNMTHELKTPLSIVSAAVESLQRTGANSTAERTDKYLNISKRELAHLSDMVEKVLQFESNDRHGIQVSKKAFDLVHLLAEITESFQLVNQQRIKIQLNTEKSTLMMSGDPAHLRNLFSNLIDNGMKYNQAETPKIQLNVQDRGQSVEIAVSDNGMGIPKIYQKDIYTLFFRVPDGNLYTVKGFGLGLAYVQQVIQQHAGTISLASTEGEGSTFTITLPKY